jgi:hypothetical protein
MSFTYSSSSFSNPEIIQANIDGLSRFLKEGDFVLISRRSQILLREKRLVPGVMVYTSKNVQILVLDSFDHSSMLKIVADNCKPGTVLYNYLGYGESDHQCFVK